MATSVAPGGELGRARPGAVAWEAGLAVALQIMYVVFGFIPGADFPGIAIVIGLVVALLTVVAAYGMWNLHRWGAILLFVVTLLDTLTALPGLFFPPNNWVLAELIVGVPLSVVVLVLVALPSSRRAYKSHS
ncbi:MAG: hypothetical protein WBW04_08200 [Nitrolancea sp.]